MIRTCVITKEFEVIYDVPLSFVNSPDVSWYWVDFHEPTENEAKLLADFFHFHPLAIEDCLEYVQRPKLDFYDRYSRVLIIQNYTYAFHKFGHTQTKQRPSRISNREEAAQRKNGEQTK